MSDSFDNEGRSQAEILEERLAAIGIDARAVSCGNVSIIRFDVGGFTFDVAFESKREKLSCAACPEMDNPESFIFHLMRALERERDTCKNVAEPPSDGGFWSAPHFECSNCGHKHVSMSYVYFCPNCGAKVVDE